jgi:hypothetical protein
VVPVLVRIKLACDNIFCKFSCVIVACPPALFFCIVGAEIVLVTYLISCFISVNNFGCLAGVGAVDKVWTLGVLGLLEENVMVRPPIVAVLLAIIGLFADDMIIVCCVDAGTNVVRANVGRVAEVEAIAIILLSVAVVFADNTGAGSGCSILTILIVECIFDDSELNAGDDIVDNFGAVVVVVISLCSETLAAKDLMVVMLN